jgi:[protein-PII] uridylyltransferase
MTLSSLGHNLEVALIDTEGESAIDVFYITTQGAKLDRAAQVELQGALLRAIAENAKVG